MTSAFIRSKDHTKEGQYAPAHARSWTSETLSRVVPMKGLPQLNPSERLLLRCELQDAINSMQLQLERHAGTDQAKAEWMFSCRRKCAIADVFLSAIHTIDQREERQDQRGRIARREFYRLLCESFGERQVAILRARADVLAQDLIAHAEIDAADGAPRAAA